MQRLRTSLKLFFVVSAYILVIAPSVITSSKLSNDNSAIGLERTFLNKRYVVHIKDIKTRANDDQQALITYQSINHALDADNDEDARHDSGKLFEVTLNGFNVTGVNSIRLISTAFKDSCQENSSLPAWKIDKRERKFRLKINHAQLLAEKTLFLCVFDDELGKFQHLGDNSQLRNDQ